MKIVIDLKNGSKTTKLQKNDVIIYDGKQWYTTSKESLLADIKEECTDMLAKMDRKMIEMRQDYAEFMRQYNETNARLLPILERLLEEDKEK